MNTDSTESVPIVPSAPPMPIDVSNDESPVNDIIINHHKDVIVRPSDDKKTLVKTNRDSKITYSAMTAMNNEKWEIPYKQRRI